MVMGLTLPLKLAAEKLVWAKIRDGVGGRVKVVVSGGSSLPSFLEDFFEMAGVRCVTLPSRACLFLVVGRLFGMKVGPCGVLPSSAYTAPWPSPASTSVGRSSGSRHVRPLEASSNKLSNDAPTKFLE